jgi:DNA repair exonuclease SbcCD ATPase subunit
MRIVRWGLAILLVVPGGIAAAQQEQQPQTLADAAKRSREQKKDQPKATHFWDNDTVPKSPNAVSVVGQASTASAPAEERTATPSVGAGAAAPASDANAANNSNDSAQAKAELSDAKESLKKLKDELDLLTRQYNLDQQSHYGKPDYASDTAGADKLKSEESQVEAKKQEVAEAQKKADEAQAKVGPPEPPAPAVTPTNPN